MGHMSMIGAVDPNILAAGAPRIVPGMTLELMAQHALGFWLTSEDLADPDNRVTVDREGRITLTTRSSARAWRGACAHRP